MKRNETFQILEHFELLIRLQENNIKHSSKNHWRLQSAMEKKYSNSFVAGCSIHMAKVCSGS